MIAFSVSPSSAYAYGRPVQVRFRLSGRGRPVRVTLVVDRPGRGVVRRIDLGERRTGMTQAYALSAPDLPGGSFQLRLWARRLRGARQANATGTLSFHWHRFPLLGKFAYGVDPGGRFGAPRPGHAHQGQDIPAPAGTPVVAPRGGTIEVVSYQAGGAGNYVVLHGDGHDFDYVFMHLLDGSVRVRQGQRVYTGQQIADVGSTGESSGPHLHFEMWDGPWAAGGHPVDPLPYLRQWDAWS